MIQAAGYIAVFLIGCAADHIINWVQPKWNAFLDEITHIENEID